MNAGEKQFQVVIVSGDQNQDGWNKTMEGAPWVGLPFGAEKAAIEAKVPCTGYPTPGIINLKDGNVLEPDAFGKVSKETLTQWLGLC